MRPIDNSTDVTPDERLSEVASIFAADLSERARQRAAELANDADLRSLGPRPTARSQAPAQRVVTKTLAIAGDDQPRKVERGEHRRANHGMLQCGRG